MGTTKNIGKVGSFLPFEGGIGYNRTGAAIAKGDCLMADIAATATETTTDGEGATGKLGNFILPVTAALLGGIFVIALEAADDNELFRFCLVGVVDAKVDATLLDGTDAYDVLAAQNGEAVLGARGVDGASAGLGLLLENVSSASDALALVYFDGRGYAGTTNDAA